MSKSRDKRLAVQRAERPLSERGLILLFVADQYGVEHVRVNDEIAALEEENKRLTEQVAFLKDQLVEVSKQKIDEINRRIALEEGGDDG